MKSSVKEIKSELENLSVETLIDLIMRVARFKKENKEFLTYLLIESQNEEQYVSRIKEDLHLLFTEVNVKSFYITKKNLRRIIRLANRYIKYSSDPVTMIEIYIYMCTEINDLGLDLKKSPALLKMYTGLITKIEKNISALHEDLRYDYLKILKNISNS